MIRNIISNLFTTLTNVIAPLLMIPVLQGNIGMNGYGEYAAIISGCMLLSALCELGFSMNLTNLIVKNRFNSKFLNELFTTFVLVKAALFFLITFSILLYSSFTMSLIIVVKFILILLLLFNPSLFLNGYEDYSFIAKANLAAKLILALLIIFLNFNEDGLITAIIVQCISLFVFTFILYYRLLSKYKLRLGIFEINSYCAVIKSSLPYYWPRIGSNSLNQGSTFISSLILSSHDVGIYSIGFQLYNLGQNIVGAVSRVLYTFMIRTRDFNKLIIITLLSLAVLSSGLIIVNLFGKALLGFIFDEGNIITLLNVATIFYITLFFSCISSFWGYPALTAIERATSAHIALYLISFTGIALISTIFTLNIKSVYVFVFVTFISEAVGMIYRLLSIFKYRTIIFKVAK